MRNATPTRVEYEGWGESTAAIVAMGLVLAVAGIVRALGAPTAESVAAFELFVSLLVPTGLATGGYWLAARNVSPAVRWRAVTQVSVGIVAACALALWLTGYLALEGGAIRDPLALTTTLAGIGGATGFATAVRDVPAAASAEPSRSRKASRTVDTETLPSLESIDATPRSSATTPVESTPDGPTTEIPTRTTVLPVVSRPADVSITVETRPSTAVWTDVDAAGRTAAPARPLRSSDRDAVREPGPDQSRRFGRDAFDRPGGPRDSLESPIPTPDPGVDAVTNVPSTAEAVLGVLRNERARLTLAVLYHEWDGRTRSVDALARAVALHTDDSADAVAAGLRHATLPRLVELRAVDWDRYADRVGAPDHAVFEEGVREAAVLLESFEPGTR
ncbi:hypothetical protein A6E15_06810 [Natrinema saccharevitans]|uniref:Uncharacterized protein n=1 Tax=Natrinema saccharevitans TaxID=301967 RepID=A0A1S8AUZ0_9EURY|nr:hypothetical protein [Natrinema saccharevitans]OLZ40718.1 hypothetical protein A6E15_06810 [Natrinema saccharevitans]